MRRLAYTLAAGWLGLHGWLWTQLPPMPSARVPGTDCRFSADGRRVVTKSGRSVCEYDVATGRRIREWEAPFGDSTDACEWEPSADGRRAVIYNRRGDCVLFDFTSGRQEQLPDLGPDDDSRGNTLRLTADGRFLVSYRHRIGDVSHALRVDDTATGRECSVELDGRPHSVKAAADGRTAAVTSIYAGDLVVQFIDLTTVQVCRRATAYGREWGLRRGFSPDGTLFAADLSAPGYSTTVGSAVFVWDVASGQTVARLADSWFEGWRADGRLVARRAGVQVVDVVVEPRTGAEWPLTPQPGVGGVEMDATGRVLVTDKARTLPWSVRRVLKWFRRPNADEIWNVLQCYDLDGRELAEVPASYFYAPQVSPDGRLLAVRSKVTDGMIDLYGLPPRKPGGVVLGLMTAQVGLLTVGTAWRRGRAARVRRRGGEAVRVQG